MSGNRGLGFLKNRQSTRRFDDGPKDFYLKLNGAVGKFRFLTDEADIYSGLFHETTQLSRNNKSYPLDVLCNRELKEVDDPEGGRLDFIDPPEKCAYCRLSEDRDKERNPWWKGLAWVYVYHIWYPEKPRVGGDDLVSAMHNGVKGWGERVNEPRLWMLKKSLTDLVAVYAGRNGTLTDRTFEWVRTGVSGRFYELLPDDPSEPGEEIKKALAELPDLAATVEAKYGQGPTVQASAPAAVTEDAVLERDAPVSFSDSEPVQF